MGLVQRESLCSFLHAPAASNREPAKEKVVRTGESRLKHAMGNRELKKKKEQGSSSVPKVTEQTDVKSSGSRETSPATRAKIFCLWGAKCETSSCDYRHPPVCRNYKSGNGCIYGMCCLFRHADSDEKPSKKVEKLGTPGAVAILKESKVQGCVSHNSDPQKSILWKAGELRANASAGHTIKFSGRTWSQILSRERKGPSQGVIQKCGPHERNLCAPEFEDRTLEETSRQEDCARKAAWNLARRLYKHKNKDKTTFYSSVEPQAAPVLISQNPEDRMFVVDSRASMHMLSKKDLSSDEIDTLRRSRNPTTVVTANGEVQTNEEAQIYVHDLDLFVTVQLLEETPAVLSLGKLGSEHGYSFEWINGQEPHLTKDVNVITCKTGNFVPLVVPGLPSSSSSSSSSVSKPKDQSTYSGESGTSSDPVTTRRDKHACGKPMLTDPDNRACWKPK